MNAAAATLTPEGPRSLHGRIGMLGLIAMESAMFMTFVVTYLFYIGKSVSGPYPEDVLGLGPVLFNSACLLSSSLTVTLAVRCLRRGKHGAFRAWMLATILLAAEFLWGTWVEWEGLIFDHGLTLGSNLFGTTYYSLVGLHAFHVILGMGLLTATLALALAGVLNRAHGERVEILSWYWHFVDAVWVVVFTTVYLIGR